MLSLYSIFLQLISPLIKIYALFNIKANKYQKGITGTWRLLNNLAEKKEKRIWIHCASLGEFEQARPIINHFKDKNLQVSFIVSFFSPSGYEIRKNYEDAEQVIYLPIDTKSNSKEYIRLMNPDLAIFIKYEFWFNYLTELSNKKIPTYYVSALFRPNQYFFKWYGKPFIKVISNVDFFFCQNNSTVKLLAKNNITNAEFVPDTRFDRVFKISENTTNIEKISNFITSNSKVFVCGSTWPIDNEYLKPIIENLPNNWKTIIAPHDIIDTEIKKINSQFSLKSQRFSDEIIDNNGRILIIDSIGMLSKLYRYADLVYIGGGFGKNVHNTLEAAVYGKPIIIGPNYKKFNEVNDLTELKGIVAVKTKSELEEQAKLLVQLYMEREKMGKINKEYITKNLGGTEQISQKIIEAFAL